MLPGRLRQHQGDPDRDANGDPLSYVAHANANGDSYCDADDQPERAGHVQMSIHVSFSLADPAREGVKRERSSGSSSFASRSNVPDMRSSTVFSLADRRDPGRFGGAESPSSFSVWGEGRGVGEMDEATTSDPSPGP